MKDALHLIKESTMYWMQFTQSTSTSTKRETTSQVKRGIWVMRGIMMINDVHGLEAIFNRGHPWQKSGWDMSHLFIHKLHLFRQMESIGLKVIN